MRDKRDSDRFEGPRRQILGCETGPEAVPVAGYGYEAGNSVFPHEVIDFSALHVCRAVVSSARTRIETSKARAWPGFRHTAGEVLRVGAHVERGNRVAPDFPCRFRFL